MSSGLPIVVLRSNDICFLGILRSCAAAGVRTIPVVFDWPGAGPWWSEASRHFHRPVKIPNPYEFPEAAAEAFSALGKDLVRRYGERLLVLGSSDTNLMFLQSYWHRFEESFVTIGHREFSAPRPEVLRKDDCMSRLGSRGVAVPITFSCRDRGDIQGIVDKAPLPCIYKPAEKDLGQTFYRLHGGDKAVECRSRDALRSGLTKEIEAGFPIVVQEKIDFQHMVDEVPFYLYTDRFGKIRVAATAIKEYIQPFPYGTATVLRLAWHPELLAQAQAVVDALEWRGILMIEFIRDRRDGIWKVIELNPRPWLFFDFFRRCGLNYIEHLVKDISGTTDRGSALQHPHLPGRNGVPAHVDVSTIARVHDAPVWLQNVEGPLSFTFLDPDDEQPGLQELAAVARKNNREEGGYIASLTRLLPAQRI